MTQTRRGDFAPDFAWGCATSSYQIEGAAREGGRGESIWDRFCERPGAIRDGSSGAVACDHFHRWREDLDLARALGFNAYRFSIAWPRIFPDGQLRAPNQAGLDFYKQLVDGMLERGLDPWATLYHWDLPQALQDRGGWVNRDTAGLFAAYADVVARALGDRVGHWITHNEPWCTAMLGYHEGVHAPGLRGLHSGLQACHHVLLSHGLAVSALRAATSRAQVGITLSLHPLLPATAAAADQAAVRRHDGLRNRWFLDVLHGRGYPRDTWEQIGAAVPQVLAGDSEAIAVRTDFLGINYYFPEAVADAPELGPLHVRLTQVPGVARTAFGWPVSPQGMVTLLERVQREYAPAAIYITENGASYEDTVLPDGRIEDSDRLTFLREHISAAHRAIESGVPLRGYFAWSLLDNFEWAEGYLRRFGIVHVDFASQRRTPKASALWFRQFLRG